MRRILLKMVGLPIPIRHCSVKIFLAGKCVAHTLSRCLPLALINYNLPVDKLLIANFVKLPAVKSSNTVIQHTFVPSLPFRTCRRSDVTLCLR